MAHCPLTTRGDDRRTRQHLLDVRLPLEPTDPLMQSPRHLCPQAFKPLPRCERSFLFLSLWENIAQGPVMEERHKIQKHSLMLTGMLCFSLSLCPQTDLTWRALAHLCHCQALLQLISTMAMVLVSLEISLPASMHRSALAWIPNA